MAYSWNCPFCNHHATITNENTGSEKYTFNFSNKYGSQTVKIHVVSCPNPDCKEYTLAVTLHDYVQSGQYWEDLKAKKTWNLIPQALIKVFPNYVPDSIISDYKEACLIRDLSPKAAATLSRRCLQGIIRDFWGISKGKLVEEIEAIKDKVDPMTWNAIDAVRKIGNIGAHMEKDINLIVDVEPQEAGVLIGLIENLIHDWYIVREERKKRMQEIVSISQIKTDTKNKK
ncbi:MAG: DUF4145 domain-containing protein [Sedimentisphaerales bacterium]|jgi:hypothetical protein